MVKFLSIFSFTFHPSFLLLKDVNDADMNWEMDIGKRKLSWEVRFNVAVRIAEALDYLHRETLKPVIHRDVKSSNILLSQGFEPQVIKSFETVTLKKNI